MKDLSILIPARVSYNNVMFRKPHTEETKRKISLANKGRVFSNEWRKNMSIAQKGRPSWRKGKKFVPDEVQREKRQAYIKSWRLKNKDKIREQSRSYAEKNKERRTKLARLRYRKNPQRELDLIRFRKYGISGDEFREIIEKQNGKCPICTNSINKNFSVDHEHGTGRIRGIICNNCNLAIGNAGDSPDRLRAMASYLEKNI